MGIAGRATRRAELDLLLCCARTCLDAEQQRRLRALCAADLDWDHLVDEARRHGVDARLCRHLAAVGPPRVPAAALDRLRAHAETNAVRNRMLAAELAKVLAALEGRGVAAMPYKGPVLAASVYGDLSLRRFADLDVLVRRSDVLRTKAALAPLGYAPRLTLTAAQERAYLASQCEYAFEDEAITYDARIFGVWPLDALGLCCFRLGRFEDSARYYASAEAAAEDAAPYRARRWLGEARLWRAAAVRVSPPPPPS